jgi:septum formation protein
MLLTRLKVPFETFAPHVDEIRKPHESVGALVLRLAELKARAAQPHYPRALVIGADQVATVNDTLLGKPVTHACAVEQLTLLSGKQVDFLTGLCLFNTATNRCQVDSICFSVVFRPLTALQIENYLQKEKPYQCAGAFKSEGLGIVLLERMQGPDPTALIGLPLIRLVQMLEAEGQSVFNDVCLVP